ncbi:MAG: hypothetical protein A2172_04725 [Candidatus Woykebacteria bacterium RBG_13_40_15]|uniref:histidine kinase n=1 Tax=Candidatus Woykebacteria bacterium RBG_13_40_15 TaxID=1802593 RepID=A0A1G1W736_9BACT|nr:MAG: hypothetical protein A2172_04725 [Candidatus Woykebacteria bacterium RBG_13_40_15]
MFRTDHPNKKNKTKSSRRLKTVKDVPIKERLIELEKNYKQIVDNAQEGIWTINAAGITTYVNKKMANMLGYKSKEMVGVSFFQFMDERWKKEAKKKFERRKLGIKESHDFEFIRRNGKRIYTSLATSPIKNEKGKFTGALALASDITARKRAEEALIKSHDELEQKVRIRTAKIRKSRNLLEKEIKMRIKAENVLLEAKKNLDTIFKSTKEGLGLYDREGRVIQYNPALIKLFGVKRDITGVPRKEIAQNREKYFSYYTERFDDSLKTQKLVYSGEQVSNILIKIHANPPRYLEATYVPVKKATGEVIGMLGSFRDVTTMKTQEVKITKQLFEAEKQKDRWQAIFENVEEGIFIIDRNLRIVQANDKSELMSGYFEKEMIGKTYYEVFDCHDRRGVHYPEFNPVTKALVTGEAIPYEEHLHTCKDGREVWVGVSYTPIFDDKGKVDQLVGVIRDVTAIKELERAKSEFVSLASHELRTPLTVINGYLSLLLSGDIGKIDGEIDNKSFMVVTKKIYSETNRLTKLVEDLLNVSRIEEGRLKINFRKVQFTETVSEVINDLKPIAEQKNIKLMVNNELSGRQDLVLIDRDKIKQVLVNLIDNAIKYTKDGGRVKIEFFAKDGEITTEISDTGIGIRQELLPRVFEKFQQATGSYLKENKGSGLGLFIVKSLVEFHNGKVWAESELKKGSKFTFTLPLIADK